MYRTMRESFGDLPEARNELPVVADALNSITSAVPAMPI